MPAQHTLSPLSHLPSPSGCFFELHVCGPGSLKQALQKLPRPSHLRKADWSIRVFFRFTLCPASKRFAVHLSLFFLPKQISTDLLEATRSVSAVEARRLRGEVKLCLMGHSMSDRTDNPGVGAQNEGHRKLSPETQ